MLEGWEVITGGFNLWGSQNEYGDNAINFAWEAIKIINPQEQFGLAVKIFHMACKDKENCLTAQGRDNTSSEEINTWSALN